MRVSAATAAVVVGGAVALLCGCTAPSASESPRPGPSMGAEGAVIAVIGDIPGPVSTGAVFDPVSVAVTEDGAPVVDRAVTFHVASGPAAFAGEVVAVQTDVDGVATAADLLAMDRSGEVTVVATAGSAATEVLLTVK